MNVIWGLTTLPLPKTTQSKPSEEWEGDDRTEDREASSIEVGSSFE